MENEKEKSVEQFWKEKIREHWKAFTLCIAAGIACAIAALIVLIWHIQTSPIGLQGTATFDQWSLDWIVWFVIVLILWELVFVGIPAGLMFGLGWYLWWQRLTVEERKEFKEQEKKNHRAKDASGVGFVFFIAYCIYVAIDGNYFAPFGSQPYSYWLYSYILTIGWLLIIIGIPGAILCVLYFTVWRNKSDN